MLIIGAHKCGTTSLQKYYEARGCDVIRNTQLFTRWDGPEIFKSKYSDRVPVVILRNPVKRAWADYNHRLRRDMIPGEMNYETYCEYSTKYSCDYLKLGELNIIEISKYQQWLDLWKDINPLVLWLEKMKDEIGFSWYNEGAYKGMTEEQEIFTRELINETN